MSDEEKIKALQKQINELSAEMLAYRQKLFSLQQEINRLQGIADKPIPQINLTKEKTVQKNFRLENFIGLRLIHFIGIVVLVVGLSIGVKYAIDRQLISEGARIILAYLAGLILLFLSWILKKKYQLFSAILFSGAMASLYFTTYAAFVYYGFFSYATAFLIMIAFTVYAAFEAIRYNKQEIAVLGMVGAYGIPFLISANSERADLFFSYITVINVGIVFLSFKKKWKVMAQLALFISWGLFILWGFFRYQEKDFLTGLVLVIIFYFLFIVNALAYRLIRSDSLTAGDIQQVMTNNIALYISALIVFGYGDFGTHIASTTGWIALFMILFAYLGYLLFPSEIILQKSLAMQAVVVVTLFIGFQWSGFIVTLLWVALAVVLFLWGILSHRSWPRLASILLTGVTLGKLIIFDSAKFSTVQKIIAYIVIGSLLLILSFLYQKLRATFFGEKKES